jgi:hypothetical protein
MPGIYLQYVCKYDTKFQRSALNPISSSFQWEENKKTYRTIRRITEKVYGKTKSTYDCACWIYAQFW